MMSDFLIIVAVVVIAAFFWQLRQMAELSKMFAEQSCAKQRVQFLSIAMVNAKPTIGGHTGLCWHTRFMFEFSTNGENLYQAHIHMKGKTILKVDWPIFPEPDWQNAPMAKGKFGGCGSGGGCNSGKCR
ncbi:DUF3301 domain-containing protein [Shewanella intestini]|uniref:DUF3301 domain-containing protein n=1 Tax=Shewanella intestini TaxID=2017544 RepID=A0ABS5HYC3_9GAMM|nr:MULTISPECIES: DUF3301 domain-containing protein [Shewanella]MBR9726778.1 DUF3301 domain-containing protein [Shewanella intestini]MRG34656.1 DUF3301 domain-containing protein [Shewanella sp. XMDDZSB0408]